MACASHYRKKKSSTSEKVRALEGTGSSSRGVDGEGDERQRSASLAREGSEDGGGNSDSHAAAGQGESSSSVARGGGGAGTSGSNDKDKSSASYPRHMTESEKRYEEVRRKRMAEKVRKEAKKSHKDRVQEFNDYLERLSEHHDLPRVGAVVFLLLLLC